MRIDALDDLAVKLENKPEDAMGRRMLGPEVDREVAGLGFCHGSGSAMGVCVPLNDLPTRREVHRFQGASRLALEATWFHSDCANVDGGSSW